MENLEFKLSFVDGSMMPRGIESGTELIHLLFGGDIGPPTKGLVIEARTDDGQTVRIGLAADDSPHAHVAIEVSQGWATCRDCDDGKIYQYDVLSKKSSTRRCDTCGGLGRIRV